MQDTAKPNVLIIMTDQQRYDSLGCYHSTAAKTPHLDQLAAEGALFENCVVANPVCTPSRASMWTGKDLPDHGVYRLYDNLHDSEELFPKTLQRHGYRTGLFGKLHVSSMKAEADHRHPNDGFDEYEWCNECCMCMESELHGYRKWLEEQNPEFCAKLMREKRSIRDIPRELHMTHWAADKTIDFIDRNTKDGNSWFACMSIFDPHNPYDCGPQEYIDRIDPAKIPPVIEVDMANRPAEHGRECHEGYLGDHDDFNKEDIDTIRRGYFSMIELLDDEVGRVMDCLRANGQLDNTLVIFTSDHGDMIGDYQLFTKGAFFYNPCVNVPLLVRWPGKVAAGTRIVNPVQNYDIAATVLHATGISKEQTDNLMPKSRDLVDVAAGKDTALRDYAICRYRNTGIRNGNRYWDPEIHGTMIRNTEWKLNYYHTSGNGELYDMINDPQERHNLWDKPEFKEIQQKLYTTLMDNFSEEEMVRPPRGGENLPDSSMILGNAIK